MKLVRISSIPDKYLRILFNEFCQLEGSDYEHIKRHYFDQFIALADVMTYELNALGTYEAIEIVVNHEVLQKQWAVEHQVEFTDQWQDEILRAQIRYYNAEIIFVNAGNISSSYIDELAAGTDLRLKLIWDGYVATNILKNKGFDLVLTCVSTIKERYNAAGMVCEILPFAFDKRVLTRIPDKKTDHVSFIGSLSTSVHESRRNSLLYLLHHHADIKLFIDNIAVGPKLLSRAMIRESVLRMNPKAYLDMYILQKHNLGVRFGVAMYKESAASLVNLNFHALEAGNMRLFEATGLGTCLLTDNKPGLIDYFQPELEVVTFSSDEELLEKVRFLIQNPEKARQIGAKAQEKVFEKHLWSHRIQLLDEMIRERI